jgi:hypothetical protein
MSLLMTLLTTALGNVVEHRLDVFKEFMLDLTGANLKMLTELFHACFLRGLLQIFVKRG